MPQCVFGEGAYRCTSEGTGDPPLCREHWLLLQYAEEDDFEPYTNQPGFGPEDFFQSLLDTLLQTPAVKEVVGRVKQAVRDPSILSPHYQGPGQAYSAEAPPRPHGHRQPPPPPPPRIQAEDPRAILHFGPSDQLTVDLVRKRQRQLARLAHPDQGGSLEAMQRINAAADALISQLR